jgi:hypothetical protein
MQHFIHARNRFALAACSISSPYQCMFNKVPSVSHLREFGLLVHGILPPEKRSKLGSRTVIGRVIGYNETAGDRILLSNNRHVLLRDIYDVPPEVPVVDSSPSDNDAQPQPPENRVEDVLPPSPDRPSHQIASARRSQRHRQLTAKARAGFQSHFVESLHESEQLVLSQFVDAFLAHNPEIVFDVEGGNHHLLKPDIRSALAGPERHFWVDAITKEPTVFKEMDVFQIRE